MSNAHPVLERYDIMNEFASTISAVEKNADCQHFDSQAHERYFLVDQFHQNVIRETSMAFSMVAALCLHAITHGINNRYGISYNSN